VTDAHAQWPVYWSSLYRGDTVSSCPSRLVWYWLCKSFQNTIRSQYTATYSQSPSFTSPALPAKAIFPPRITTCTSFERHPCPQSVQKYQINLTQRCIRRFWNSQLWTAIPCTNWREQGTRSLWTGARIWLQCTHRLYTGYLLNFGMGCCTMVNHFTAQHLLSIWDLIAR